MQRIQPPTGLEPLWTIKELQPIAGRDNPERWVVLLQRNQDEVILLDRKTGRRLRIAQQPLSEEDQVLGY